MHLELPSSAFPTRQLAMAEPRMRVRQKGQQFATQDRTLPRRHLRVPQRQPTDHGKTVEAYLIAFGDDMHPLPETVKVLDEIVTE